MQSSPRPSCGRSGALRSGLQGASLGSFAAEAWGRGTSIGAWGKCSGKRGTSTRGRSRRRWMGGQRIPRARKGWVSGWAACSRRGRTPRWSSSRLPVAGCGRWGAPRARQSADGLAGGSSGGAIPGTSSRLSLLGLACDRGCPARCCWWLQEPLSQTHTQAWGVAMAGHPHFITDSTHTRCSQIFRIFRPLSTCPRYCSPGCSPPSSRRRNVAPRASCPPVSLCPGIHR